MRLQRAGWGVTGAGALILYLTLGHPGGAARPLPWKDISAGVGPVEFGGPQERTFRSQLDLASFLRLVETGPRLVIPRVDFSRNEVLLFAVGPRSSRGYALAVRRVSAERGSTLVTVDERAPTKESRAMARLTFPFVLVALPRSDRPIAVNWPQRP